MTTIKFVVKVNRTGTRVPAYVHSTTGNSIQMTPNRKLALVMGKFAAEDAINSIRNARSSPELVMVKVTA
jgi:vancomycin permeability regulator SanA